MVAVETVARRVADRIARERAAGDDWRMQQILESECEAAGVIGDEARANIAIMAATLITGRAE